MLLMGPLTSFHSGLCSGGDIFAITSGTAQPRLLIARAMLCVEQSPDEKGSLIIFGGFSSILCRS